MRFNPARRVSVRARKLDGRTPLSPAGWVRTRSPANRPAHGDHGRTRYPHGAPSIGCLESQAPLSPARAPSIGRTLTRSPRNSARLRRSRMLRSPARRQVISHG